MHWSDRAIVLASRSHGEGGAVLEAMTREHGRHLGLVHGGRSRRLAPVLQPGNAVELTWRARLEDQLGTFQVEAAATRAARLMSSGLALSGLATLAAHLRGLPERDPHPELFDAADSLLDRMDDPAAAPGLLARFEILLLAELGFGLDLASCALSGATEDLAWVSPATGRAASRSAGEPWRDRLLPLPAFLLGPASEAPLAGPDLAAAFRLSGHFLDLHVWAPSGMQAPDERSRFVARAVAESGGDLIK
ncbi:DNA repair protein RecO [Enterovirga sp.]|uniref:DNA repair protein RecO n=1 Tax=Enterovirga sp. TaxID=2026350 RepID=UPI002633D547|nr:DNA repair protein RecO [Enterovirga sp.]